MLPGQRLFSETRARYGFTAGAWSVLYRILQKTIGLRSSCVFELPIAAIDWHLADDVQHGSIEFRALAADEIRRFAADPLNDLSPEMAERLEAGTDTCFGALGDGRLLNYSWYALGSIEPEHAQGVPVAFPSDAVYLYKAYTPPKLRGARLHQATFLHAIRTFAERGYTRVIAIVESGNWASLHSHARLGFRPIGRLTTIGRGPLRCEFHPRLARQRGLRFGGKAENGKRKAESEQEVALR
jgi:GNAT superfamily N-acetyltransferase